MATLAVCLLETCKLVFKPWIIVTVSIVFHGSSVYELVWCL